MRLHVKFAFCILINVYFIISVNGKTLSGNVEASKFVPNLNNFQNSSVDTVSKITYLKDSHRDIFVHWVGNGSNTIICLTQDVFKISPGSSSVYISYDYGDSYENKTHLFVLENRNYATIQKFYNHPKYASQMVFTDVYNKVIFATKDLGRNIYKINVNFKPEEVSFHESSPDTFLVLQKSEPTGQLWITEDFGNSWRLFEENVNSFFWMRDYKTQEQLLVIHRKLNGSNEIIYFRDLNSKQLTILASDVKDIIYAKEDYIFFTKNSSKDNTVLFFSHKLGVPSKCTFDTELDHHNYYVVDVTKTRALVAVIHSETLSHLYVSEYLNENNETIHFHLSLQRIFCYSPTSTWKSTWLQHSSIQPFADIHKVSGVTGIYVASQITVKDNESPSPEHFISLITFDYGDTWKRLNPSVYDSEGKLISCSLANNCSLHLHQRFSHLHPDRKLQSIRSSASAPGVIIATGVIGKSLQGHSSVYISTDAGLSWNQTLKDPYLFQMGNYGGVITAVKYDKNVLKTNQVLFSTDFGQKWTTLTFHDKELRVYAVLTEPNETTAVFTIFASKPNVHEWNIIKLDLKEVFSYNCSQNDFEEWSPNHSSCVLEEHLTYSHKIPAANCYTDSDYIKTASYKPCACDITDFECDSGFFASGKPFYCIRNKTNAENPYEVPSTCKPGQFYNRTKGYRKIQGNKCVAGFERKYLPDVIPCPIKKVNEFLLISARDHIVRYDLLDHTWGNLSLKNLKNVVAIDFDMKNNCVYWSDTTEKTIRRQCLPSDFSEVLVSKDLITVEGMAFDWISRHLYFVDGVRAKIELIKTDINQLDRMRRTILDSNYLGKPRAIAVHPVAGYLFWTDWSTERPAVSRSNLDGSDVKVLFNSTYVWWPNGITIDYIAERIYWIDARKDYIGSSDLNGNNFIRITQKNDHLSHPFAIATFKDNIYWNDWNLHDIFSTDKENGLGVKSLGYELKTVMMDMKVFGHGLQEGINGCVNSTCSHICVSMPENGHRCLCPDSMILQMNTCVCPNKTCPEIDEPCPVDHFTCNNGTCVPRTLHCNGKNDCGDGSDETHCDSVHVNPKNGTDSKPLNTYCNDDYFQCHNTACIPKRWHCDGEKDCRDGSDELNCPPRNCSHLQFACDDGCIPKIWKCDGNVDCNDKSDEKNCSTEYLSPCKSNQFRCTTGGSCIPIKWHCDGETDCKDGSDELNCPQRTCSPYQFTCTDGTCIPARKKCNGANDCPDRSDESGCVLSNSTTCKSNEFRCTDSGSCIPILWKCDIDKDCIDGSDELNCPYSTCSSDQFTCLDGTCVPAYMECNGANDCPDKSDERLCPLPQLTMCSANQFLCTDGSYSCIPLSWRCDHQKDCKDGSDEFNCPKNCSQTQFECEDGSRCIPITWKCNNNNDCIDHSDEKDCIMNNATNCRSDEFRCQDSGLCIPLKWHCDLDIDCDDGSDELGCTNTAVANPTCSTDQFTCKDGTCIPAQKKCNGANDCPDKSDETWCPQLSTCSSNQFQCTDSSNTCIPLSWRCDNQKDCKDGSDEVKCPNNCTQTQFRCGDGTCIPITWKCDDENDCLDKSDEKDCIMNNATTCRSDEFRCQDSGLCMPFRWRCDMDKDCADGSDELGCTNTTCTDKNCTSVNITVANPTCSPYQFKCKDGTCVPAQKKCNGVNDCPDKSDERWCPQLSTCSTNQFQCTDGTCIPLLWRCDNQKDCKDDSDEFKCPNNCSQTEFRCGDGTCISLSWRCDNQKDCKDGSDEFKCPNNNCSQTQFRCGDGTCISITWKCDNENDCLDRSDEKDCIMNNATTCRSDEFRCQDSGLCIPLRWYCDMDKDCADGSDELGCTNTTCTDKNCTSVNTTVEKANSSCADDWMFRCSNGKCIPYWWKCDRGNDCGDNSDEMGCTVVSITTNRADTVTHNSTVCQQDKFQCRSGSCILRSQVCDGSVDCKDGEDEDRCDTIHNCLDNEHKCRKDKICIPVTDVCDGKIDCQDKSDEENCNSVTRVYQVVQMGVDVTSVNESSFLLYWWIPLPDKVKLEFLPSISKYGLNEFENKTWINDTKYKFMELEPYTKYNVTVYARIKGSNTVLIPAKYFIASTAEGIPSEPWNVTAEQRNSSHLLISWQKPIVPNGIIQNYELSWSPPEPSTKIQLSGDSNEHFLSGDFQVDQSYSFSIVAYNKIHKSNPSENTSIVFKGDTEVDTDVNLLISNVTVMR